MLLLGFPRFHGGTRGFWRGECETKWPILAYRKLRRVNIITKLQRETVKVTVCVVYLKTISNFLELDNYNYVWKLAANSGMHDYAEMPERQLVS